MVCRRIFKVALLPLLLLGGVTQIFAYPYSPNDTPVVNALNYLRNSQQYDGSIGGFAISSWAVIAISSAGEDPHAWKKDGGPSIVDYLKINRNQLDLSKATDVARYILSMTAASEDPRNIDGVDYVAALKGLYDGAQIGDPNLLNDDFWGILALISAGEWRGSEIVRNTVSFIKGGQNGDGGWGYAVGSPSDVDDTSAAIMALIAAGESKNSIVIIKALSYIKSKQMDNGGFESWGTTNVGTDSWAIQAIVAAGQIATSPLWTKNGKTPVDDLLTFQNPDGSFSWPEPYPMKELATSYAIPALLGKPYPVPEFPLDVATVLMFIAISLSIGYLRRWKFNAT
jgi:iron complex transport system substrate-binding protein